MKSTLILCCLFCFFGEALASKLKLTPQVLRQQKRQLRKVERAKPQPPRDLKTALKLSVSERAARNRSKIREGEGVQRKGRQFLEETTADVKVIRKSNEKLRLYRPDTEKRIVHRNSQGQYYVKGKPQRTYSSLEELKTREQKKIREAYETTFKPEVVEKPKPHLISTARAVQDLFPLIPSSPGEASPLLTIERNAQRQYYLPQLPEVGTAPSIDKLRERLYFYDLGKVSNNL